MHLQISDSEETCCVFWQEEEHSEDKHEQSAEGDDLDDCQNVVSSLRNMVKMSHFVYSVSCRLFFILPDSSSKMIL
jgi:hypothetical protein